MPEQKAPVALRKHPRIVLCLLATMALAWHVFALPPVALANDDRDLSDYEHTYWMAREGVPGQVSDLAQTMDGYLWLATGQTLFRFDGVAFERFQTMEGDHLPKVSALAAHPDGSLWVGLHHGGLARISDGRTTSFGVAHGVPAGRLYDLAVGQDGMVMAAIGDELVTGSKGGWHVQALAGAGHNARIRVVLADRDGGAWAGGAQLWHRQPGHPDFVPSAVAVHGVGALAQAPDGTVWAAESTSSSIFPLAPPGTDGASDPSYSYLTSSMVFDQDGGLWIGTTGDGIRYVPSPGSDTDLHSAGFTGAKGLSGEVVGSALIDREGNLWFGTNAGLDRFRQSQLMRAGFPSAAYNFALAIDSDGAVWGGSMNRDAMRLAGKDLTTSQAPHPITVAYRNPDGDVWLAGPGGFWRTRGTRIERIMGLPDGVDPTAVVRAILEDGNGGLWASINDHGLYFWQAGVWSLEPVRGDLSSQAMPVRAVLEKGRPWFGYRDNLLVSLQDGQALRWDKTDGLAVGHVTALLATESRFWVGGTDGLSLFTGKSFVPVRFANGFRISGLHGLVETVTGELWLHGDDGLFRIEADQITRFLTDPLHPVKTKQLGPLEPLADDGWQVRPLPTAVASADGVVWLATSVGVRRADPLRVAAAKAPPPAHVVSLRADSGPIETGSGAVLPALARRIVIAYTATGLKSPETLRFRYRLRGYDDTWDQADSAREATYIGLPPGQYDFELSAAYGDGPWSVADSMTFEIPPALHQTKQFIALCAAGVVLLLWGAYRMRVRHLANRLRMRLEVQHRERHRIARELHDTLLQSVQGLILRFQAASNSLPANEPARTSMELALDQADQVMVEGRDRVTELRIPAHRAGGILKALSEIGREQSIEHGVRFKAIIQGQFPPLPAAVEEELFRIAREALINAFRHADASEIEFDVLSDREGVRLRIRDDGMGMPASVFQGNGRTGHWGIIGMQERAEKIGARFEIWSREGSGTEADICLPWTSLPGHTESSSRWLRWFKQPG